MSRTSTNGAAPSADARDAASVKRTRNIFLLLFLIFYMTDAAGGYLMIYLKSIGYNTLQMGMLTSAASLVALFVQPFIGGIADRAPTRNRVLMIALVISGVLAPMLRLSTAFFYILVVYTCYIIARNIQHPLTDTITLEYTARHNVPFGPIRIMGCIGYASMAAIAGTVAAGDPSNTFFLYTATAFLTVGVLIFVPKSSGVRMQKRANPLMIFKNATLLKYTLFAMIFSMTKSFYHQFFSVYFTSELGGPTNLYGFLLSIAALTEIPLIFSLDKLIKRFGTKRVIIAAGCIESLRWLMTATVLNPYVQLGVHAVLGAGNMIMSITMVMFVNSMMPPESKATGQATYTMLISIGSMIFGNFLGGALSNVMGIRPVFFICVAINAVAMVLFLMDKTGAGETEAVEQQE